MDWDELAEAQSQHYFASWLRILMGQLPDLPLKLAAKHRPGKKSIDASGPTTGAYNICVFVTFDDGSKAVVRFPIMGRSRFRVEKTNDELLAMAYLASRVKAPLPEVYGTGDWGCGPYIVMSFIDGIPLSNPFHNVDSAPASDVARAYKSMANILIELYDLSFPRIGSLTFSERRYRIGKRPLTLCMNEFVRVGNLPPNIFTSDSFPTASTYFQEVANQHFLHLKYQRNNAIDDEEDCRKKYVARCLFRKITREIRFARGPFRLYCDDMRPSNVLVASETDFTVKAVIDWEYTYAAPVEYSHAAPWWLLFESPEAWESDLHKFLERYKPRLEMFLDAMKECENERIADGRLVESGRLSGHMAQSMDNGVFWLSLAAKKETMFDDIYWAFVDKTFFGPFETLEQRLSVLTQEERDEMEGFVQEKMKQKEERTLDEHMTMNEMMEL